MSYTVIRGSWGGGAWDETLEEERQILAEVDATVEVVPSRDDEAIEAALPRADGVYGIPFLGTERIRLLERARGIVTVSHGFNYIDLDTASELGIPVGNEFFCHREVANHTMLLLLAWVRKLVPLHNHLAAGRWRRDLQPPVNSIYGQTLGLVGFGHIGREVAKRARGFDLRIVAYDPYVQPSLAAELGAELVELDDLLRVSDYVSIHAPASDNTRHLIGERELGLMRPSAAIFNTARGDLIDEAALYRALVEKRIAGAGIDVFEVEPTPPDNPLLKLENVVLTPHAAGYSDAAVREGFRQGARDMARIVRGQYPTYLCNPDVRGRTRFAFED